MSDLARHSKGGASTLAARNTSQSRAQHYVGPYPTRAGDGRRRRRAGWAAALVLAGIGLIACGRATPRGEQNVQEEGHVLSVVTLTPEQLANAGITTTTLRRTLATREITLTGAVGYDETGTARVAPRIAGRVVRIAADFGARVKAGDVLAVLDSPELGEAQAAYLARLAEHRVARHAYDRAEALHARKAISEGEYLEREGAFRRAEAELGLAENRLHLYDMNDDEIAGLGRALGGEEGSLHGTVSPELVLRSPIGGVVTRRELSAGQVVDRLQTLYVVSDLARVWAWLDAYERDLAAIATGSEVVITSDSFPASRFAGHIDFVGEVEPDTRAARVRVRIASPEGNLRPGMFVRARLTVPVGTEPVLAAPKAALQELAGRTVVFRITSGAGFEPVEVTLGRAFDGVVEITAGVAEGDEIVTAGAFTLKGELLKAELAEEE